MHYRMRCLLAAITILALELCFGHLAATSEESPSTDFGTAFAKAHAACLALWADPVFDSLRKKIPLGGETNPTIAMLTNPERIGPKDKPVADKAVRTVEKCRALYAPAFALLPQQTQLLLRASWREEDNLIAQAYAGKITIGAFNVRMNRLNSNFEKAIYGPPAQPTTAAAAAHSRAQLTDTEKAKAGDVAHPHTTVPQLRRIALVVGNGAYQYLPRLGNPAADASSIYEVLRKMGFAVTLVLDANEQNIRNAVRKFANESERADLSLVFYAGHGAQVNGENYLLPVDMDAARTEADIQLTGLKVDDLINSIQSNIKVVFLDACRDNPVLYKYVKGRSASPAGLAPPSVSKLDPTKPGGAIFIAYATDSGSVAFDGAGQHSPFTQALLHNLDKPTSIDDMFSYVTHEVLLSTKDTQRPFKYASMESIVCLTGACSNSAATPQPAADFIQETKHSETEDFEIALNANNSDALETFLRKYPDSVHKAEIRETLAGMRRSEFDEWTLFDYGGVKLFANYMQLKSLKQTGDRVAVRHKFIPDTAQPIIGGKSFPEAASVEQTDVFDCTQPISATSEVAVVGKSGEVLYHYKWSDPELLNLSFGFKPAPGSIQLEARNIACSEELRTPLLSKKEAVEMRFNSLSSTPSGDGDIYYKIGDMETTDQIREALLMTRFAKDRSVGDLFKNKSQTQEFPNYRLSVSKVLLKCGANQTVVTKVDYYDTEANLVYFSGRLPLAELPWINIQTPNSPFGMLYQIGCTANEASK
jgi:hypothetical protein